MKVLPPERFARCALSESSLGFTISCRGVEALTCNGQPPFHYVEPRYVSLLDGQSKGSGTDVERPIHGGESIIPRWVNEKRRNEIGLPA